MIFFHGTTEARWKKIQEEGVLWGGDSYHRTNGAEGYRYTYLTPAIHVAQQYGRIEPEGTTQVMLLVSYEPIGVGIRDSNDKAIDNYVHQRDRIEEQLADPDHYHYCWQFSVFKPIPIAQVIRI